MGEIGVPPALEDAVDSIKEAINAGRTDIFRKLLEACESCDGGGVEERLQLVNSLATNYGTFLHMATKLGHCDIIRALLLAGADPGVLDRSGNTPIQIVSSPAVLAVFTEELLRATANSEIGRVCQLVASGLSVNSHDNKLNRNTPLHWAASFADLDTLNCLIARGADVNSCNNEGATPLHDAIAKGEVSHVETLLQNGANIHMQCIKGKYKGQTALQMAEKNPKLQPLVTKYKNIPVENEGTSAPKVNGKVSPELSRQSFVGKGSYESLTSVGADSVITQHNLGNRANSQSPTPISKLIRAQSITSVGSESPFNNSTASNGIVNGSGRRRQRSPLESTSSLELTPNMEQVCERLSAVQFATPIRPLVTSSNLHNLWPQPKRITELSSPPWKLPTRVNLTINSGPVHEIVEVWNVHKPWLSEAGCDMQLGSVVGSRGQSSYDGNISCVVNEDLVLTKNHYTLTVEHNQISIVCGSLLSLHHCIVTFVQLLRVFKTNESSSVTIPALVITDYPSLPNRGFLMDLSATARVPKLERICQIVDSLLSLKINQLHLLFKIYLTSKPALNGQTNNAKSINYSFRCHLPYSSSELVSLERYCSDRGISLIPVFDLESSDSSSQSVLVSLFQEVIITVTRALQSFPSAKYVHFGPYLTSFLIECERVKQCNCWAMLNVPLTATLMVCANMFDNNLSALNSLPLATILVEYGFQADYDFSKGRKLGTEKGRPIAICSGTAAWTSLSGWPEAGVSNAYSGVVSCLESGGLNLIVAHYSNSSVCLTPFVFCWPPLLVAAGLAWNHSVHWDFVHTSVGSMIDQHLVKFPNCGLGDALIELGRCETWLTRITRNQSTMNPAELPCVKGSTLYQFLTDPDSVTVEHLTNEAFSSVMRHARKAVREGVIRGEGSNPIRGGIGQIVSTSKWPLATVSVIEIHLAMDMILTACRLGRALVTVGTNPRSNMGMAVVNPGVGNLPPTIRTDLANKILALRDVHSSVWLQGNQTDGLQSSLLVFSSLLSRLLPEQTIHGI